MEKDNPPRRKGNFKETVLTLSHTVRVRSNTSVESVASNVLTKHFHYGFTLTVRFLMCHVCHHPRVQACVLGFDAIITLMMYHSINKLK